MHSYHFQCSFYNNYYSINSNNCYSINSEWQEGLLPQLLTQFSMHTLHAGGHRPAMEWIVLDGTLNDRQIDNLLTLLSEDGMCVCTV